MRVYCLILMVFFYNRTTNSSGHARLNINLDPGDYNLLLVSILVIRFLIVSKVLPVLIGDDVL